MRCASSLSRIFRFGLAAAVALTLASLSPQQAAAQGYPNKPIRIIIPFGPGGFADITLRIVADKLGERLGHRPIIDNRPSGGGIAAAQAVATSPADGYTLIVLTNGTAITPSLFKSLPFDPVKDFVPISSVAFFDVHLLVNNASPIKTVADLVAEAKKRPGALNMGAINPGSTQSLSAELFKATAGLEMTNVPFKTSPDVLTALLRDDIVVGFETYAALKGGIDGKQIRSIASTGPTRSLPDVPTTAEAGLPSYEVYGWNSLFAPAGTPPEVVALLNKEIKEILALPDVQAKMKELGAEPKSSTPAEVAARLAADIKKWAAVIELAKIEKR